MNSDEETPRPLYRCASCGVDFTQIGGRGGGYKKGSKAWCNWKCYKPIAAACGEYIGTDVRSEKPRPIAAQRAAPQWKSYSEKLRDPRWQKKKTMIQLRDGFSCRDCGSKTKNIQVHHCHYRKGDPWDTEDELLLTLCEDCHLDRQELENGARNALGLLMAGSSKAELEKLANALAARASAMYSTESAIEWLGEERWVEYARQFPDMRIFVEMVLGRHIQWPTQPQLRAS